MLLSKDFNLVPYLNLIHIVYHLDRYVEKLKDLDKTVWELARKHEEVPNFQRIYAVVICNILKDSIASFYNQYNLEIDFYINYDEPHFFVNHSEIKNLDDLEHIIKRIERSLSKTWYPDYIFKFSEDDALGIKVQGDKVEYAYGHQSEFKNVQDAEMKEGYFNTNGILVTSRKDIEIFEKSGILPEQYFQINDTGSLFRIKLFEKVHDNN